MATFRQEQVAGFSNDFVPDLLPCSNLAFLSHPHSFSLLSKDRLLRRYQMRATKTQCCFQALCLLEVERGAEIEASCFHKDGK